MVTGHSTQSPAITINFGVAPAPVPEGHPIITWCGGFSWAIPVGARHPEQAWEFIEWISRPETYTVDERSWPALQSFAWAAVRARRTRTAWSPRPRNAKTRISSEALNENLRAGYRVFVSTLKCRACFRPVTPVGQKLWDDMCGLSRTPPTMSTRRRQALQRGQIAVQEEVDRTLQRCGGAPHQLGVAHCAIPAAGDRRSADLRGRSVAPADWSSGGNPAPASPLRLRGSSALFGFPGRLHRLQPLWLWRAPRPALHRLGELQEQLLGHYRPRRWHRQVDLLGPRPALLEILVEYHLHDGRDPAGDGRGFRLGLGWSEVEGSVE